MNETTRFAVCIRNTGYEGALELRKLYQIIDDPGAAKHDHVRIVDESGEDYLYPKSWFLPVELPKSVEDQLVQIASK